RATGPPDPPHPSRASTALGRRVWWPGSHRHTRPRPGRRPDDGFARRDLGNGFGREGGRHEPRREYTKGMRTSVAVRIAALLIGTLVSSCAMGGPPPSTAPACVFIERCRNPALTTRGGEKRGTVRASSMVAWRK